MESFVTTYLIVWLAVVLYVGRLHTRQRRLEWALQKLQRCLDESDHAEKPSSGAA